MILVKSDSMAFVFTRTQHKLVIIAHQPVFVYLVSSQALINEEKQQRQADKLLKMDERQRSYPFFVRFNLLSA